MRTNSDNSERYCNAVESPAPETTGAMMSTAGLSPLTHKSSNGISELRPRIALLTPYTGANLGDASIQDAVIANLRRRLPGAQFSGICMNCDNFVKKHGVAAFPLLAHLQFDGIYPGKEWKLPNERDRHRSKWVSEIMTTIKHVPVLSQCHKVASRSWHLAARISKEIGHAVTAYRFLHTHDLLVVSGGGQLGEEWGGPWQHPFGLFKWAVLARIARVPYIVLSVGVDKLGSKTSKVFVSAALRMACYRSYRDQNSKNIVTGLVRQSAKDPVVPDLAFSLPSSDLPPPARIRAIARGRKVIAISPIAYGKPGMWWFCDRALYDRYVREIAQVASQLLRRGCFLVMVYSSLGDDESVIAEILGRLDEDSKQKLVEQLHVATIETWRDLVATLRDADFLIASRLHSAILGFVSETPTVAISSGAKVDWLMKELGQAAYLLQISDFTSEDVIEALSRLELHRHTVLGQIVSYRHQTCAISATQYDALVDIAMASTRIASRTATAD